MAKALIWVEIDRGGGQKEWRPCSFTAEQNAAETALIGIDVESPDGLTTKTWSLDNSGNLLLGGVIVSTAGYVLDFGSDVNTGDTGKYMLVDGRPGGVMIVALSPSSERTIFRPSTLKAFGWNSQAADVTSVFKVLKNGSVVETITCTKGVSGSEPCTEVFAVDDLVAVEFDAGTVTGNTGVELYFE